MSNISSDEKSDKEIFLENSPIPIDVEGTNIILNQMKTSVCKIYKNKGGRATGFFCSIPMGLEKVPVLITNNHVIDEDYIKTRKKINLSINDDKTEKTLELNGRKYYSSEKYDTTIIELFPERDEIYEFLQIDDKIYYKEPNDFYQNESVYLIQYPKNKKLSVSYGIIKNIYECDIYHYCSTEKGSSGSPIISISTKKLIGIHKEGKERFDFNIGTLLKNPILEFIDKKNYNINGHITPKFLSYETCDVKDNNHNIKNEKEKVSFHTDNIENSPIKSSNDNNSNSISNKKTYQRQQSNISVLSRNNNISENENETLLDMNNKLSFLETNKNMNFNLYEDNALSSASDERAIKSRANSKISNSRNNTHISYSNDKLSKISNHDNQKSFFISNIKLITNTSPKPGLVGLSNKKFPYYMNSIIQSLSNTKRLRNYLLAENNYQKFVNLKNEGMKLSFSLYKIIKNIWEEKNIILKGVYDSTHFINEILNEIHDKQLLNNPIQIIKSLLSSLNNELEIKGIATMNYLPIINKNNRLNIYDFNEVYDNFKRKFNKNKTIIMNEFGFYQKLEVSCCFCQKKEYHINQYYNLAFNLDQIKAFLNNNSQKININDCFNFFRSLHLIKEEQYYCRICKNWRKASLNKDFITLPRTLIICFDKKKSIKKEKIIFKEKLELKIDNSKIYYNLISAINRFSETCYIAYCKNSDDNNWYKFNDESVTESSFEEISSKSNHNQLILFFSTDKP